MICGQIIYIDRFGTCVTNIRSESVKTGAHALQVGRRTVPVRSSSGTINNNGALCAPGQHGYLELSVPGGSAERIFSLKLGSTVSLS